MATSGEFITNAGTAQLLVKDAFERIGTIPDVVSAQQYAAAIRSINLLLSDWGNRNFNFWTMKQIMLGLNEGIKSYALPLDMLKVVQCELRTSTRQLLGVATASDGATDVEKAFNDDLSNGNICKLDGNTGYIKYTYATPTVVNLVGIRMFNGGPSPYSFNLKIADKDDFALGSFEITDEIFPNDVTRWFSIPNYIACVNYVLTQSAGDADPSFVQIYFNNNVVDITMSEVSQYNYLQYPRKQQLGRPTIYYVNYQLQPELYMWEVPSKQYNCAYISYQQYPEKVTQGSQVIGIPANFAYALTLGVAADLAQRYAPERAGELNGMYQQELQAAILKNRVNLSITLGLYGTGT